MPRCALVTAAVSLLLLSGASGLVCSAQTQTPESRNAQPAPAPSPQTARATENGPTLECQGCHAPGKTLPYLGGAKFHTEPHAAYDRGFHARGIHGGMKAANCVDCHSRNGDLTNILPATDPKSTINRSNIAETCGRCHGDKSAEEKTSKTSSVTSAIISAYRSRNRGLRALATLRRPSIWP